MEKKPSTNVFQEVHRKSQAVRNNMRKAREAETDMRKRDAREEAVREGFDSAATDIRAPGEDESTR
jgi:hypothetical protein